MSIMQNRLQLAELCNTGMLYRKIIDHLPPRLYFKDTRLTYVFCNETYARDLNIRSADISGKSDFDLFSCEVARKIAAEEAEILRTGAKKETEEKYVVSGQELIVVATKTPIRDDNGTIIGLQVVLQDITQDRRRAKSLASLIKNLEDLLAEGEAWLRPYSKEQQ